MPCRSNHPDKKQSSNAISFISIVATLCLAACGGGSATVATTNNGNTVYSFVTPTVGARSVYTVTDVDNLNNTLNRSLIVTVLTVNTDGTYTASQVDPSGNSLVTGSVDHTFYPTTARFTSAGQEVSWTETHPNGSVVNCSASPYQGGAPSPLQGGQTWSVSYTETCGAGTSPTYNQNGSYQGTESVTVPAGTFTAFKLGSTVTWTSGATSVTETVTRWRNADRADSQILKQTLNFQYSGTAPVPGTLTSETRVLQSLTQS